MLGVLAQYPKGLQNHVTVGRSYALAAKRSTEKSGIDQALSVCCFFVLRDGRSSGRRFAIGSRSESGRVGLCQIVSPHLPIALYAGVC